MTGNGAHQIVDVSISSQQTEVVEVVFADDDVALAWTLPTRHHSRARARTLSPGAGVACKGAQATHEDLLPRMGINEFLARQLGVRKARPLQDAEVCRSRSAGDRPRGGATWFSLGSLKHTEAHPEKCVVCEYHQRHLADPRAGTCRHGEQSRAKESKGEQRRAKALEHMRKAAPRCKACRRDREQVFFACQSLSGAWWDWSGWHDALAHLKKEVRANLRAPDDTRIIPIVELGYTHNTAYDRFGHGAHEGLLVSHLADMLRNGAVAATADEMVLDVVFYHSQYYSLNNRHLKTSGLSEVAKGSGLLPTVASLHVRYAVPLTVKISLACKPC